MRNPHQWRALLSVVCLLLLDSCGGRQDQMAGTQGESTTEWDFAKNGVVHVGRISGRYTFGDRGRMKIKDNNMTWKEPNGSRTELQRVP
ncbi:MAG: hypothetical protein ACR2NX_07065 [Chthoniobacterales bacterium]